jgi:hypothetical protein
MTRRRRTETSFPYSRVRTNRNEPELTGEVAESSARAREQRPCAALGELVGALARTCPPPLS